VMWASTFATLAAPLLVGLGERDDIRGVGR